MDRARGGHCSDVSPSVYLSLAAAGTRTNGTQTVESTLFFDLPSPDEAVLTGTLDGSALRARLSRIDTSNALLVTRGFRWITEAPLNR